MSRETFPGIIAWAPAANVRRGAVAQLGARLHGMQKVEGSNPSSSSECNVSKRSLTKCGPPEQSGGPSR